MKHLFSRWQPWLAILFLLLSVSDESVWAQSPTWQWDTAVVAGGGYNFQSTVDSVGNTYVTGYFRNTATFGSFTLTSSGQEDAFVAKLNSGGSWQWAVAVSGAAYESGNRIALDRRGNVYVTGNSRSATTRFGAITLTLSGQTTEMFVAKLNAAGVWQWAEHATGFSAGLGIDVDSIGNVFVAGAFSGRTVTFGSLLLLNTSTVGGASDVYVARLDSTGAWQWARAAGGANGDFVNDLAVDRDGNILVTGGYEQTMSMGSFTLTSSGRKDVFAAKLSPVGGWLWAVSAGGSNEDYANALAVDSTGNAVLIGAIYSPTAVFGTDTLSLAAGPDVFVAKVSPTGTWQWARAFGGGGDDFGWAIATDRVGNAYVTGHFTSPTLTLGNITLTSSSTQDMFLARLDANGVYQWGLQVGVDGAGRGVGVDRHNHLIVTGNFSRPSVTFGATTLTGTGPFQLFVSRLSQPPLRVGKEQSASSLQLLPNPARESVQVMGEAGVSVFVLNALGRVVLTATSNRTGRALLNVRNLPVGLYLIRAGASAHRLVVE